MEIKKRDTTIDFLRGIAVFAMILIHTSYYFLSQPAGVFFWNYAQFAVQVFVYCSAFLFFRKPFIFTQKSLLSYIKKRFLRLLVPYYIFVGVYVIVNYYFHNSPINFSYIKDSLLVTGGVEIDWLVLLFIEFTFLMPLLSLCWEKYRALFWGYTAISLISSLYLYFFTININYRAIMWLPWSLLCILAILIIHYGKSRFFMWGLFFFSLLIYIAGYVYKAAFQMSPSLFDNKYPPNLYYLLYGVAGIVLLTYLNKIRFIPQFVRDHITFLSTHSYSLYFIHYTLLSIATYFLAKYPFSWYVFFLIVFIPSVILQWGYVKLQQVVVRNNKLVVSS